MEDFVNDIICSLVRKGSKVLDLGCGTGNLMLVLKNKKSAFVQGIEISEENIFECIKKGVNVLHADIDEGLADYPNKSFDYVILNNSMQQMWNLEYVLKEALRVGGNVIVVFPNFAYIKARFQLGLQGIAPLTDNLPYRWENSPNIHFFSIKDFRDFCSRRKVSIIYASYFTENSFVHLLPNLFAQSAIFVLEGAF